MPIALSIDFNLYWVKRDNVNKILGISEVYIDIYILNVLLLNILFELQYHLLVYLIETETLLEKTSLIKKTGWEFFGFCSKYWTTRLIKCFSQNNSS